MHGDKHKELLDETPKKCPGRIENVNRERTRKVTPEGEMGRGMTCRVMEESGVQTYMKMDGPGEKVPEGAKNANSVIENQITTSPGLHFILSRPTQQPPTPRLPPKATPTANLNPHHFKSLDNMRNITQQSMAPSQKTILIGPPANGPTGVYQSHVRTERIPLHTLAHHSHIDRKVMGSPARVSLPYVNSLGSTIFNSYIPIHPAGINAVASKMAPCISERQMEYGESAAFWRERYEELNGRWEAMRLREVKEHEVGVGKLAMLEQKYSALQDRYEKLSEDYSGKLEENQQYYLRIQELQATVNQLQLIPRSVQQNEDSPALTLKLKQKQEQIQQLTIKMAELEKTGEGDFRALFEEKCMLVGLLRRENEQFQSHLHNFEQRYEQEMRQMHEHVELLQGELEHRDAQAHPRDRPLKASSMLRSQLSAIDRSFDNSNSRAVELQAHIAKLNAELAAREAVFEKELKQANLNVAELAERLKSAAAERDKAVGSLQEKVAAMESDINKKQSAIRNMRDEVAALRSYPSVYSSTLNPAHHRLGDKDEPLKRELQNLRRSLFDRQREKMILKQKIEELQEIAHEGEQALERKKLQNQQLRRHLGEVDNLEHEHEKMLEVISKKNADIAEMREMLLEKEQEVGNFENLTKENDRLRNFMLKKNEELSEMAERLFTQEKKAREAEATHSSQLTHLEDQNHHLQEVTTRREHELSKLAERYEQLQGNFSEVELQLERQRHINEEYESLLKTNADKIEAYQEELAVRQEQEQECQALRERLDECEFIINEKEQFGVKALRQIKELSQELEARQEELQEMAIQETHLRDLQRQSCKELADFENRHGDVQSRCRNLEIDLKKCLQKVSKNEKELEVAKKELKKHQKCSNMIEQYKQKMALYEMKLITLNMNRNSNALKYHQPVPVFERKVIYQLKEHNERLQEQLRGMKTLKDDKNLSSSKEKDKQIVNNRLAFFSQHLEQVIQGKAYKSRSVDSRAPHQRQDSIAGEQIERLMQLVVDMQTQEQVFHSQSFAPHNLELLYKEQLKFYRTKNEELEERVDNLIRVNKQLKQALDNCINNRDKSLKEFYEAELARMEREIKELKSQRKTLQEKVKKYEDLTKGLETECFGGVWQAAICIQE